MIIRNNSTGHIEYVRSMPIDWIPLADMNDPTSYILKGFDKTYVPEVLNELGIDHIA